jgi:hypothetical protein
MQDNHPDAIPVQIGGRERLLKFTLGAFVAAAHRKVRFGLADLAAPALSDLPVLVWIGLLTDYPRLTLDTVVKWVEEGIESGTFRMADFFAAVAPRLVRIMGAEPGDVAAGEEDDELAPGVLSADPLE